jgi:hypothetical protein
MKMKILGAALALAAMSSFDAGAQAQAAPAASAGGAQAGTVIFFREKKFTGAAIRYKVRENGAEICKLKSGTFCTVTAPVGEHVYLVHTEAKDALTLKVEPGVTYYVLAGITMGFMAGHPNLSPSDKATFEKMKDKLKDNTGKDLGGSDDDKEDKQ